MLKRLECTLRFHLNLKLDVLNDCKLQSQVKLMQLWSYDEDADEVHPGENVKMKVSGVEEEVNY